MQKNSSAPDFEGQKRFDKTSYQYSILYWSPKVLMMNCLLIFGADLFFSQKVNLWSFALSTNKLNYFSMFKPLPFWHSTQACKFYQHFQTIIIMVDVGSSARVVWGAAKWRDNKQK